MNKILTFTVCIALFFACNSEKQTTIPSNIQLLNGLTVSVLFNNNLLENISNKDGINSKASFCENRKHVANNAMHFNRADSAEIDFGDLALASFPNAVFSVSCWINLEDTIKPGAVLSKRSPFGGFEYSIDNHFRNKQFFNFDNWNANGTNTVYGIDPLNASVPIAINQWQHLIYIADGKELKAYCNGVLQSTVDLKNNEVFANTDKHFVIGNGGGYGKYYYFQGAIDDVKIYNRVLNNEEINALFIE